MLKCWIYRSLTLVISIILAAPAFAISRCTAADGSVSYVQGNCPNLNQKREGVRVWDSGKGMKIGPDEPTVESYQERIQAGEPNRSQQEQTRGPRHPCNSQSSSPIQYKAETKACAILNGPHDPDNDACRSLASGNWQFEGQISVPKYKALMARCQATTGSTKKSSLDVIKTSIKGEFEGWEGETIFLLDNGQIWQQSNYAYMYHYAYRPEVMIIKVRGSWKMKVDGVDEMVDVIRLK